MGKTDGQTSPRTRTEDKLEKLLTVAAALMAKHGYDQTTIRDVGRETGFSLAGMYYYFKGKEDLLAQIQKRTFASLLEEQEKVLEDGGEPAEQFRRLVRNHLSFFTRHMNELKVCTYELESVSGEPYDEIERLRRRYFRLTADVVGGIVGQSGRKADRERRIRHITLFAFGMLNWVFMWFEEDRDSPVDRLADDMVDLVLTGVGGTKQKT
jgi:AcrR family transcriptional regulator